MRIIDVPDLLPALPERTATERCGFAVKFFPLNRVRLSPIAPWHARFARPRVRFTRRAESNGSLNAARIPVATDPRAVSS